MAKILLVDDEESLRTAVNVVLTSKGHSVTLAESGMAAQESEPAARRPPRNVCRISPRDISRELADSVL